jgi:hypothetical protein
MTRTLIRPIIALLAVASAGAAGAIGATSDASVQMAAPAGTVSPQAYNAGTAAATPTQTVDGTDAATFSLLDRPLSASDAVPAIESGEVKGTPFVGSFGANLALSREATGFSTGGAWVVPGDGSVCLIADPSYSPGVSSAAGLSGGATCQFDADAVSGQLTLTGATMHDPGHFQLAGLVPNGVATVAVTEATGATVVLPVHDNVYMADLTQPAASVTFVAGGQTVTLDDG